MNYAAVGGAHKEAAVGGAILLDRRLWGRICPDNPGTKGVLKPSTRVVAARHSKTSTRKLHRFGSFMRRHAPSGDARN